MSERPIIARIGDSERPYRVAAVVGLAGVVLWAIGLLIDVRSALLAWLTAFSFWSSIVVGALVWLMSFFAANARWPVVARRPLEQLAGGPLLLAALFVPIAIGMKLLYPWVAPDPGRGADFVALMRHKAPYLNPLGFVLRAVVFLGLFALFADVLLRLSRRQDQAFEAGELTARFRVRMRQVGSVGLPLCGLAASFAAFDWVMSLEPRWYSTIFGIYWWTGGFAAAMALWIVLATMAEQLGPLRGLLSPSHFHSMGKLLFAMVCFWAYIGFSQLLLIWIGNLPDETEFYRLRARGGWLAVSVFLIIGHFVLPFLVLLSRELKRQPLRLSAVSLWILLVHWIDSWWLVAPTQRPHPIPTPWDLFAVVGIGGLLLALGLWRGRGWRAAPVGDPYLGESLRYRK